MNLPAALRRSLARWTKGQRRPSPYPVTPPLSTDLLAGRCALITGAGRNIGRAIALEMARQGATILFTETDPERTAVLERELVQMGIPCWGFSMDAADAEQMPALSQKIEALGLTVDLLVNNAALQVERRFLDLATTDWQRSFTANVIGPAQLSRTITAALIAAGRPGSILFITSIHQWEPALWPAYSSAKAGLGMLIQEMAAELAPHGIRVNGIAPGWVTEERQISRFSLLHGSTIDPVYIGRAAVFLASEHHSRYTTGTVLTVDAGLSLLNSRIIHTMERG
ncbi:MAG: SDR family oxidoreductase [Chloroflexi bacterium]|nr:SDR family oxidoreductase [Chloroflexota bacterium]MBP6802595.1 SDR family oxidoreductase [Chloroflexota bacterium]